MARRHGWQLPAHPFQVVAITVFFLLSVAFYAFFAPFLGKPIFEYIAEGIYSFLALCVFILYVRCTAIDPADPGILVEPERGSGSAHSSLVGSEIPGNLSTNEEPTKVGLRSGGPSYRHDNGCFSMLCGLLCCFIMKEDCRNDDDYLQQQSGEEDALFCTLCNAEVRKMSKHCRSCDKCVNGFDHHCRWLNNCVGRNNYITFICLMAASLLWLVFECAVGIAVLVRCFADKKATEDQIIDRLGDGFSRPPFATVVAVCTAVSFLATVPLGELFFFHIILIRKGITTYEYIVAMRTQSEPPGPSLDGGGDQQQHLSLPSSPTGSAVTAMSGRSSVGMGLQYKGAWCTPPRIFMDHQDEIIPHLEPGRLPSTVDPDNVQDKGQKANSRPVRISAWKLAKLDSNEAIKAGAKARASSSVLRPVGSKPHHYYEHDHLSSTTVSGRSSPTSTKQGNVVRGGTSRSRSSYPPSRASREDVDSLCGGHISNLSSPLASNLSPSPLAHQHNTNNNNNNSIVSSSRDHFINPIYQSSSARGSEFIENQPLGGLGNTRQAQLSRRSSEESARSSVYWDPEAGRFMSRSGGAASMPGGTELTYTGQSIFFGGPLMGERSGAGAVRLGGGLVSSVQQQRGGGSTSSSYYQQGRSQRGGQLPVFVPSDSSSQQQPQQHQFSSRFE